MVLVVMTNQSKGKWHFTLQGHWGAAAAADQERDVLCDAGGGGGVGVRGGHRHAVQTSLPQGDRMCFLTTSEKVIDLYLQPIQPLF